MQRSKLLKNPMAWGSGRAIVLIGLTGCGEWKPYTIHNDATGQQTACFAPWGSLSSSPEWAQRLHQCIAACEERGFRLRRQKVCPHLCPSLKARSHPRFPLSVGLRNCANPRRRYFLQQPARSPGTSRQRARATPRRGRHWNRHGARGGWASRCHRKRRSARGVAARVRKGG